MTPGCLHKLINEILQHNHFTDTLIAAIDACVGGSGLSTVEQENARQTYFRGMIDRVVRNARDHPHLNTLRTLVHDDGITDHDAISALEFVYSCLVKHLKGELAEVLARPLLQTWASHLSSMGLIPEEIEIVQGHDLRALRAAASPGQHKCADAILLVTPDCLLQWTHTQHDEMPCDASVITAVVEIKAFRAPLQGVLDQLVGHINRFGIAWNLRGVEIDGRRTLIAQCNVGGKTALNMVTGPIVVDQVPRLFVRPCKKIGPVVSAQQVRSMFWVSELSFTSKEILEAAFRFSMWLASQVASDMFDLGGTEKATQTEGTGCLMEIDSTAQDRLLQALYYLGREEFLAKASPRKPGIAKTFFWLYNVFSYGRERACGDRIQWPEDHPELPRHASNTPEAPTHSSAGMEGAKYVIAAQEEYTKCRLHEAKQLLEEAKVAGVPAIYAYKASWLAGMIAYRQGEFIQALHSFPGPRSDRKHNWWRRDQLMLARLHARAGLPATARSLLLTLEPIDQWLDRAFPVEYCGVGALVALRENDDPHRQRAIHDGLAILDALLAEIRERRKRGLSELSTVHPQTLQMAVFDLAAVLVATQEATQAIHLLSQLSGFDGWELDYLAQDKLLAPLFRVPENIVRLTGWLEQERGACQARNDR